MRLFFFGDSILTGHLIPLHEQWTTKVSEQLAAISPGIIVNNSSVNGNTTRLALERMHYQILAHKPDILYIQFGFNDCNFWETDGGVPRVHPEAFRYNLQEMIDRAVVCSTKKIILATNHPPFKIQPFKCAQWTNLEAGNRMYNGIIREVANGKKVKLVDHESYWRTAKLPLKSCLLDGVHINRKGHELYFSCAFPIIEKVVRELLE